MATMILSERVHSVTLSPKRLLLELLFMLINNSRKRRTRKKNSCADDSQTTLFVFSKQARDFIVFE
jgi:hypothetical protein